MIVCIVPIPGLCRVKGSGAGGTAEPESINQLVNQSINESVGGSIDHLNDLSIYQ